MSLYVATPTQVHIFRVARCSCTCHTWKAITYVNVYSYVANDKWSIKSFLAWDPADVVYVNDLRHVKSFVFGSPEHLLLVSSVRLLCCF